jgi:hypothetical protein
MTNEDHLGDLYVEPRTDIVCVLFCWPPVTLLQLLSMDPLASNSGVTSRRLQDSYFSYHPPGTWYPMPLATTILSPCW